MTSVYTKTPEDDGDYVDDVIDVHSPIQIYLQEIRNILGGDDSSVMGAIDMTVDLEALIYDMELDEGKLKQKILSSLMKYSLSFYKFSTEINISFFRGDVRDICTIDFSIDNIPRLQFSIK